MRHERASQASEVNHSVKVMIACTCGATVAGQGPNVGQAGTEAERSFKAHQEEFAEEAAPS